MRRIFFGVLVLCLLALPVFAAGFDTDQSPTNDNSTTDNSTDSSVQYKIELGNGEGAILVFGDNNTIYMPPNAEESEGQQIQPNEITYNESRDSFMLVCTETDIVADGTTTTFSKVVLELKADGTWDLVWFEQETK